jgi:hypothetical protein
MSIRAPTLAAPTSPATEPGVDLTRSRMRRILLRVAVSFVLVFLISFCIAFLGEIVGARKSHFRAGSVESNNEVRNMK